eukprot:CFRG6816T1
MEYCWAAKFTLNIIKFEPCNYNNPDQQFQLSTSGLLVVGKGPFKCVVASSKSSTAVSLSVCNPYSPGQVWNIAGPDVPMPVLYCLGHKVCPFPCETQPSILCGYTVSESLVGSSTTCEITKTGQMLNRGFHSTIIEATGRYAPFNPTYEKPGTENSVPQDIKPQATQILDPFVLNKEDILDGNDEVGLSTGALYGITAALLVFLMLLLCVGCVFFYKRRKGKNAKQVEGMRVSNWMDGLQDHTTPHFRQNMN